jgi:hypothetical protein
MTRALPAVSLAASLTASFVSGCPSDDEWQTSLEDSSGSSSGSASASATMTATDPTGTTGTTGTGTATDTSASTEPTTGTATSTATSTSTDASTGADTTTGTAECDVDLEPAEITEIDGCAVIGEAFCSEGQLHVAQDSDVDWMTDPPNSGPHYPTWESYDEHDMVVPRGNWVHNLEHGAIVLSYRCNDDCEPELDILRDVLAQRPELRILLTPDPLLPGADRFAAISWTWIHRFDAPDLDTLLCFADQHEGHAPEDVP